MKSKNEMMREIRELNPTVSEEFLQEFSVDDLSEYLERLHRIGRTAWIAWEPEPQFVGGTATMSAAQV